MSTACSLFIRRGGSIYCTITGRRQYSRDLPQGGMEVPCTFCFVGNGCKLKKLKKFFKTTPCFSDDNGNQFCSAKHVVLDTETVSTSTKAQSSSNDELIQSSPSDVVVEQPSSGTRVVSTSTIVLYDQPLLSIKKASPDRSNTELSHQPSSDIKNQSEVSSQNSTAVKTLKSSTILIDHSMPSPLLDQPTVWVTFERCILHVGDKLLIESGKELTDKHIHFAQSMVKKQFPPVGGLCPTLLQNASSSRGNRTANTIQIVHCQKRRHWITISTKWCKNNEVVVYDCI